MGKSAQINWMLLPTAPCGGYMLARDEHGKSTEWFILPKIHLGTIIHEINECELTSLLQRMGFTREFLSLGKPSHKNPNKSVLQVYKEEFPEMFAGHKEGPFTEEDKIYITHILSPYGHCGCLLPRKHNHARW